MVRHLGFVTDHVAVGETYDLTATGMGAATKKTRAVPKPIGWQLHEDDVQKWNEGVARIAEKWNEGVGTVWIIKGAETQRRTKDSKLDRGGFACSPRNATTEEERDAARQKMWAARHGERSDWNDRGTSWTRSCRTWHGEHGEHGILRRSSRA